MTPLTQEQIDAYLAVIPTARRDEPIAPKMYLKIGGPARLFVVANSSEELLAAVHAATKVGIPWYVFGGGSNMLVSDDGYEGVLIQAASRAVRIEGTRIIADAGCLSGVIAKNAVRAGLVGFEWGVGLPGTIGGAVYGNAGCFGGEMKDVVESVHAYAVREQRDVVLTGEACAFAYRESMFKREPHVILDVTLILREGDPVQAQQKLEEIMAKRKDTQPQGAFTAGCLFKNIEYQDESVLERAKRELEIPPEMLAAKRIPAGWVIDQLGLKGKTIGNAQVSPVHGNFLVNLGGATASDVIQLSSVIKMNVRDKLGLLLQDEVQYVGFDR